MARTVTVIPYQDRLAEASARLHTLTDGSPTRLAEMRGDGSLPVDLRCELAYLVKLKTQLTTVPANCYVETVVAGRPDDHERRVFARVTHVPEDDGLIIDLYTHERRRGFQPIATTIETEAPAKRRRKEPAHA